MYNNEIFSRDSGMQNDDLKSIVKTICHNLLEQINEHDETTKEQVIDYLRESAKIISNAKDYNINSINSAKLSFLNLYEDIAKTSLLSYENSNDKFEKLAELHEATLNACNEKQIDLPAITEKFTEIQNHMFEEIQKANEIIVQLSEQIKILEARSNLDPLTNVYNRRALTTYLEAICTKKPSPQNLHLLIIDIDDFKIINDTYGHIAGDKILIFIANILKKTLRDGDKIFRYGGEEFVIVLNRVDNTSCKSITERLLKIISDNRLIYKNSSLNVTMSVGTTVLVEGDTPDTLIARADKALYKAKENGKNQIFSESVNGI